MRARLLHHRNDLIALARENAPSRGCERAIDEDRAITLGGFTPPESFPYWLVQVTSRHGREWLVGITCDEENNRFGVVYPDQVHWRHWAGRTYGRSLQDGDDPKTYARYQEEARQSHGIEDADNAGSR